MRIPTLADVRNAERVIRACVAPAPLLRSRPLERELRLPPRRRAWIKDYGATPVGSFKLLGALGWTAANLDRIGDRPVTAHSSGNFASGLAYACRRFGKRAILVMPDNAPRVKFERTRALGAEIRTYDIARDHETGARDRLVQAVLDEEGGVRASPYDDPDVIAGNGVGGLEIVGALEAEGRRLSHLVAPVSGGGLMAGHALAAGDAAITGVEPDTADDFCRSLAAGKRVRIEHPAGICDGLLSYDVGVHNWPILRERVSGVTVPDSETRRAMAWLDEHHGLKAEPSGAVSTAALLSGRVTPAGNGDVVVVLSGRNVDPETFDALVPGAAPVVRRGA